MIFVKAKLENLTDNKKLVYKFDIPKEGEYEIFLTEGENKWINMGNKYFTEGKREMVMPVEENIENLFGQNQPEIILKFINKLGNYEKQVPEISFTKINPTKYRVKVEGVKMPYTLVFLESFNKDWRAYISHTLLVNDSKEEESTIVSYFDGQIKEEDYKNIFLEKATFETWGKKPISEDRHFLVNGYANSWYITLQDAGRRENYEIIIEFYPQRFYYLGLFISGLALISCLFYLTFDLVKNKRIVRNS